jgi:hypothetical protein
MYQAYIQDVFTAHPEAFLGVETPFPNLVIIRLEGLIL